MDSTKIHQLLADNYNIKNVEIVDGPRQFVAETFICLQNGVGKYFIKLIPKAEFPRKIIKSLPVLQSLNDMGLTKIPTIIPTTDGKLLVENSNSLFIVFSFIEGEQTSNYDNRKLGEFLTQLHQLKVKVPVEKEIFSSYVDELFPRAFEQSLKNSNDFVREELRQTILPYEDELRDNWTTFQDVIEECKRLSTDNFVLTHGDAPGNIMVNVNGDLFVIDWDDIMLAPAERDVWFLKDNLEFTQGYTKRNPNYQINKTYYKYYLLWRMFDDLFGWMREILSDKSEEHKRKNLEDLKNDYFNWLRPLVRDLPKTP